MRNSIRKSALFLVIVLCIVVLIIPFNKIYEFVLPVLSKDNEVKLVTINKFKELIIFFKIIFVVSILTIYSYFRWYKQINSLINYIFRWISLRSFRIKLSLPIIFKLTIVICLLLSIYALFNFDIGLDEAFYLNDIQNIQKYNLPTRVDNYNEFSYLILSSPLNIISIPVVKIFGFNIYYIRFIILGFSISLIFLVRYLFEAKNSYAIFVILLLGFPGIFYLTSCVFLEGVALFFIIAALVFLKKIERFEHFDINGYISALMMAIAIATKFQIFLYFGLVAVIYITFFKERLFIFKYTLSIYLIYILLSLISIIFTGIDNYLMTIYKIIIGSNATHAVTFSLSGFLNKSMWLSELIFVPLVVWIWFKTGKGINEAPVYQKMIFLFSIVCILYWWLFYGTSTWRNAFIGLASTFMLFSMRVPFSSNSRAFTTAIASYIILGVIINFAFIKNGSVDDVQYYRSHILKGVFTYNHVNHQRVFFKEAKKILTSDDQIYTIGQIYIPKIYFDNRQILSFEKVEDPNKLSNDSYILITYGMIMEGIVNTKYYKWIINNCELIYREGEYYLYKKSNLITY